ncbi:MAG TPA: hypothetical protein HA326_08155 [Thermoplasmata archaeon]|nr:hypothetical protein [Thermoplasmata archaeon]
MATPRVEWSLNRDPDLLIEIWSTEALVEAVLGALLEDPEAMKRAVSLLTAGRKPNGGA